MKESFERRYQYPSPPLSLPKKRKGKNCEKKKKMSTFFGESDQ